MKEIPKIHISKSEEDIKSITLHMLPPLWAPAKPDTACTVISYDGSTGTQHSIISVKVRGVTQIDEFEANETVYRERIEDTLVSKRMYWIFPGKSEFKTILREIDEKKQTRYMERMNASFPRKISVGDQFISREEYFRGDFCATLDFNEIVTGAFQVHVGSEKYTSLKLSSQCANCPNLMMEYYIDVDTGRVIFAYKFIKKSCDFNLDKVFIAKYN